MRLLGIWLALFVLTGCGWGGSGDSPEAVCRRQAYDDPKVKSLTIANLGASAPDPMADFQYNKALRDATNACLQQKGIAVRGGVEPVQPH